MLGILAVIVIIWLVIMLLSVIAAVLSIVALWKLFSKAGEEGWKSIVPIYNIYTLCTICGVSPYWLLIIVAASLLNALPLFGTILDSAAVLYFVVLLCVSVAKSFGKKEDFAIGLFFLSPIFYFILAFGKSEYLGPTPMNDPVGDWILGLFGKENTTKNNSNTTRKTNTNKNTSETEVLGEAEVVEETVVNFCKNCGAKVEEGDMFCVSCGTKLN